MDFTAAASRCEIIKRLKPNQNLLAVSKLQSEEKIKCLHDQGQIHFAENYVQEALQKIENLKHLHLQWHLIGPLQKNKVKFLKTNFSYIHSVDSFELAELISKKAIEINHQQKVFIQINLSAEPTKSGFSKEDLAAHWSQIKELSGIKVVGLMTMPPLENAAEKNRVYFAELVKLGQKFGVKEFSMGTSQDFEVALQEGSTWVRVGTLLFGAREINSNNESRSQ